jgi:hypothetical protein
MRFVRLACLGVLLAAVAACGRRAPAPSGPVFEGRHLSEWVADLEGSNVEARRAAAKTLVRMGKGGLDMKPAIIALEKELKDEDRPARYWSAVALVYAARGTPFPVGPKVGPVLKEAAEQDDEQLRAEAGAVLKKMPTGRGRGGPPGKPASTEAKGEKKDTSKQQPGTTQPGPVKGKSKGADSKKQEPPPPEGRVPGAKESRRRSGPPAGLREINRLAGWYGRDSPSPRPLAWRQPSSSNASFADSGPAS